MSDDMGRARPISAPVSAAEHSDAHTRWGKAKAVKVSVAVEQVKEQLDARRERYFKNMGESDSLSLGIKLAYCAPTFSTLPMITLLAVYGNQFYEQIGADLALMSFFIALARSFDVISDPVMSYITDSFRSRWGRRKPFCFSGCWFYSAFLFLLLYPPQAVSSSVLSAWFGVFYILFFLMNTYTNIPYDALGPELTDNYEDRSRLFFVAGLFDGIGALVAVVVPVLLAQMISVSSWNGTTCSTEFAESFCFMGESCAVDTRTGLKVQYDIPAGFFLNESHTNCVGVPTGIIIESERAALTVDELQQSDFCTCMDGCKANCDLKNQRSAFMMVAAFFGAWYVVTMSNMVLWVHERSQDNKGVPKPPPLVPSLLNTLTNMPFTALLPAWACDAVVNAIIASMTTYFVRYIVQPEFQTEEVNGPGRACAVGVNSDGTAVPGPDADSWRCDSTLILGLSVTCLLLCAVASTPPWLYITGRIGKRNAWLAWSATMAVTNFAFIGIGPGDVHAVVAVTALNGVPLGAKFLADAILADIIDYDEYLTGARSEATYTMFKSFLPKICAIPAAAIPIALLNTFGHVGPINGRVVKQPDSVFSFVMFVTVVIPSCLAVLSYFIKRRFPLKTKDDVDAISKGVALHNNNEPSVDPVSGVEYSLLRPENPRQLDYLYLMGNWPGTRALKRLQDDPDEASLALYNKMKKEMFIGIGSVVVTLVASILLYPTLENPSISFVPVLVIICFGISLTYSGFSAMRLMSANRVYNILHNGKPATPAGEGSGGGGGGGGGGADGVAKVAVELGSEGDREAFIRALEFMSVQRAVIKRLHVPKGGKMPLCSIPGRKNQTHNGDAADGGGAAAGGEVEMSGKEVKTDEV